ncbi:MAG: hypothetical protein KDA24_09270 [Deltaproteobacteria bacterium]|nr:hypothetical protein [Deltaproteobacteria bacterium]
MTLSLALAVFGVWEVAQTDFLRDASGDDPLVFLHRAGGARWPQNSRTAVLGALQHFGSQPADARFDGLEVDLVLTSDGVPVLAHDPWVHTELCTTVAGARISERRLIKEMDLGVLQSDYLCGGVEDPEFSGIKPVAETVMTFDELLVALVDAPELALYLDIKIDEGRTASGSDYASAVMSRWRDASLPNRLFVEVPHAVDVQAFAAQGVEGVRLLLSYPPFPADGEWTRDALAVRWATLFGFSSPVPAAEEAGAHGVVSPTAVLPWRAVRKAADQEIGAVLFSVNDAKDLARRCDWPLLGVITDYPDLGGCPGG